jgi:integrase
MSVNTLNKALRIMGCDTGPGGDHCAHGLRSTASTLLNEEGAFDGNIVEAQLAHDTGKKSAGGAARWCPAWQGRQEQDPRHL